MALCGSYGESYRSHRILTFSKMKIHSKFQAFASSPDTCIAAVGGTGRSFTIHSHPWTDLADLDSDQPKVDILRLQKLVVPAAAKKQLVNELLRLGISTRTLFPDLDGIARGLWQIEAMHPNR
jgi:hypothetical protein